MEKAFFSVATIIFTGQDFLQQVCLSRAILRRNNVLECSVEELIFVVSQHAAECGVSPLQFAVGCTLHDSDLGMLVEGPQKVCAFGIRVSIVLGTVAKHTFARDQDQQASSLDLWAQCRVLNRETHSVITDNSRTLADVAR